MIAKPSLAAPISAAPSLIQLRLPCLCCGLADVDHLQNIADGQFARSLDCCLVLRPHQTNPLPSTSSLSVLLLLCIPYVQCCMSDRWRRRLDITHVHSWSILSEHLYPDQAWCRLPRGLFSSSLAFLTSAFPSLLRYLLLSLLVSLDGITRRGTDQVRSYEVVS